MPNEYRFSYSLEPRWQIPDQRLTLQLGGFNFSQYWYTYDKENDGLYFQDLRILSRKVNLDDLMVYRHL